MTAGRTEVPVASDALKPWCTISPIADPVEILSCHVLDIAMHPRLPGRWLARVSVQIGETFGGFRTRHNLQLRLHVDAAPDITDEQLRRLVLETAARVLQRLKSDMETCPA